MAIGDGVIHTPPRAGENEPPSPPPLDLAFIRPGAAIE